MNGRDAAGRFAAGFSSDRGNGKPPAPANLEMSAFVRASIMHAANTPIRIRDGAGRRWRTVSLFEMMVRRLAIGQTSRRRSVVPFIKLVIAAAAIPITPGMVIGAEPRDPELHSAKEKLDGAMAGGSDDEIEIALTRYTTVLRKRVRIRSTI